MYMQLVCRSKSTSVGEKFRIKVKNLRMIKEHKKKENIQDKKLTWPRFKHVDDSKKSIHANTFSRKQNRGGGG